MGNNGSNSHHYQYQCTSNSSIPKFKKTGPGFTHTHSSQSSKNKALLRKKVLPDPNGRKLQDINNDNTPSIYGSSALTLPHDLNKIKFNKQSQNVCHHRLPFRHCSRIMPKENSTNQDKEICTDIKKFKSEPDLRYLMTPELRALHSQHYFDDEEMQEKEIRNRSKKKYKAPLPPLLSQRQRQQPPTVMLIDSKASDKFQIKSDSKNKTVCINELENTQQGLIDNSDYSLKFHFVQEQQSSPSSPPPRKSRLYKSAHIPALQSANMSHKINNDNSCSLCSKVFFHRHCNESESEVVPDKSKRVQSFLKDMVIDQDDDDNFTYCHNGIAVQKQINKSLAWSSATGRNSQKEMNSCSNSSNSSGGVRRRRRFLNWKNTNIPEKNTSSSNKSQSELIQQPSSKKIKTNIECFGKGLAMKELATTCSSSVKLAANMPMEINELQLDTSQNCSPMRKLSEQRKKKKSIYLNEGNREPNSKEYQNEKFLNNNSHHNIEAFSISTDVENVDENFNLFQFKNQEKANILKSHINDSLLELKNTKNNSLRTGISDFNSKLLNKESESLCSNDKAHTEINEKENKAEKNKFQIVLNTKKFEKKAKQSIKRSTHLDNNFLILRQDEVNIKKEEEDDNDHDDDDESEEENYLNKSFRNKRINMEIFQLGVKRQKDNLKDTRCYRISSHAPFAKTAEENSVNIKREQELVGAELESSYLNQSKDTYD